MKIVDRKLYAQFLAFCVERQAIHVRRKSGSPWPWTDDAVMRRCKINNLFRRQDAFTQYELSQIKGQPFAEQLKRIAILRHAISRNVYEMLMERGAKTTVKDLLKLRERVGKGDPYISTVIRFIQHAARGRWMINKREHLILEHYKVVIKTCAGLSEKLKSTKSGVEALAFLSEAYRIPGAFRVYETFTSLTYCEEFPWTEDDVLHVGPGSAATFQGLIGKGEIKNTKNRCSGKSGLTLDEARSLARRASKDLKKSGFDFQGLKFTVRTLEDSCCEFRKYLKPSEDAQPYYPDFFPKKIRCKARGADALKFPNIPKFSNVKIDVAPLSKMKLAARTVLSVQCRRMLAYFDALDGQTLTVAELKDHLLKIEFDGSRQAPGLVAKYYLNTLIDFGFFIPIA